MLFNSSILLLKYVKVFHLIDQAASLFLLLPYTEKATAEQGTSSGLPPGVQS